MLLLLGTLRRIPLLYLPWMLFYGLELFGGWSISLAFLLLPGKYGLKNLKYGTNTLVALFLRKSGKEKFTIEKNIPKTLQGGAKNWQHSNV